MAYGSGKEFAEWWFVPTLSSTTSPSAAQINAGTRITDDITTVNGFSTDQTFIEVPTLKGGEAPKITGGRSIADSSLTLAQHTTYATNTTRTALAEGTTGYIVTSRYKKGTAASGDRVTVWTVRIGGNNETWTADDAPMEYVVTFGVTTAPSKDVAAAA